MRPKSLLEPRPQGKPEQHAGIGYELVQALDAPVLVDDYNFLHDPRYLQEQMIVQELPVSFAVDRATQPMDVEQVLNVPVLHMIEDDSILGEFLELVTIQEIPEVQVPSCGALVLQEQVIVQSLPDGQVHVPLQRVQQRTVEQVVDAHVPHSAVSRRIVEQVVDVPVGVPLVLDQLVPQERVQQQTVARGGAASSSVQRVPHEDLGSSAAWLGAADEHCQWAFRTVPREKARQSLRSRLRSWARTPAHPRRHPMPGPPGLTTTMMRRHWCPQSVARIGTTSTQDTPVAPAVGALACLSCVGCTVSGLGILWPLVGCPCRYSGAGRYTGVPAVLPLLGVPSAQCLCRQRLHVLRLRWLRAGSHSLRVHATGSLSTKACRRNLHNFCGGMVLIYAEWCCVYMVDAPVSVLRFWELR